MLHVIRKKKIVLQVYHKIRQKSNRNNFMQLAVLLRIYWKGIVRESSIIVRPIVSIQICIWVEHTWIVVWFISSWWLFVLLLVLNFRRRYHSYAMHRTGNNDIFLLLYFCILTTLSILKNAPHITTYISLHTCRRYLSFSR